MISPSLCCQPTCTAALVCRPLTRPPHCTDLPACILAWPGLPLQMGVLLGKHTVVDAAQRVPAGMRVSLAQQRSSSCAGSDEDGEEWEEAGACRLLCSSWPLFVCPCS